MRFTIVKLLVLIIGIESCLVMAGWIFKVDALTRILPSGINMKFPTALIFFFAAIGLYFITKANQDDHEPSQVILPGVALFILLIVTALLSSGFSGEQTGLESLFVNQSGTANSFGAGWPSISTILGFIIFGLACTISLLSDRKYIISLKFFGFIIFALSFVAVIGYVLHLPVLYYQFSTTSVPMAFNTALSFVLLSIGLIIISRTGDSHEA